MDWMVGTPEVKSLAKEIAEDVTVKLGLVGIDAILPTEVRLVLAGQPLGEEGLRERLGASWVKVTLREITVLARRAALADRFTVVLEDAIPDAERREEYLRRLMAVID